MNALYVALLMVTATAAHAQEGGEPGKGVVVARQICSECHAIGRGQDVSPRLSAPPFERLANTPGVTAMAINHLLHSSHKEMPNIMLAPDDQWHVVAYILSLRRQ